MLTKNEVYTNEIVIKMWDENAGAFAGWSPPTTGLPYMQHFVEELAPHNAWLGCEAKRHRCFIRFWDEHRNDVFSPRSLTLLKRAFPKTTRAVEFRQCPQRRDPTIPKTLCRYPFKGRTV